MVSLFMAIVLCYALSALAVLVMRSVGRKRREVRHYVLRGDNHELHMEGYIRAIRWFSLATGAPVKITVVDEGSTDQTAAIVQKLAREDQSIRLHRAGQAQGQPDGTDGIGLAGEAGMVQAAELNDIQACWYLGRLRAEGIISGNEQTVLVDLRRPEQLVKLPL